MKRAVSAEKLFPMLFLCGLVLAALTVHSSASAGLLKATSIETIAREACDEVGKIGRSFQGTKEVPILILEEVHNSRACQIEHTITLDLIQA